MISMCFSISMFIAYVDPVVHIVEIFSVGIDSIPFDVSVALTL